MRGIETAVSHHPDVMNAAVGLDDVIDHHVNIIVVNVDRDRLLVLRLRRRAVRADVDAVVKVGYVVVTDHMPLAVNFDCAVRL